MVSIESHIYYFRNEKDFRVENNRVQNSGLIEDASSDLSESFFSFPETFQVSNLVEPFCASVTVPHPQPPECLCQQ